MEKWKPCAVIYNEKLVEFLDYEVSNLGRVKRTTKKRGAFCGGILSPCIADDRPQLNLPSNGKYYRVFIHRLVAHAFIGPCPVGKEVNHKNGKTLKNEWKNLEYLTPLENTQHALKLGLINHKGENNPNAKLTEKEVLMIKKLRLRKNPLTQKKLAKHFNISLRAIEKICQNKTWKHL